MARALSPGPAVASIRPMLAPEASFPPFSDRDWLYEIKFDGYRCLAEFGAGRVELRTRTGALCNAWYPEVVADLKSITGGPFVVDAEACWLDASGRSDFDTFHATARSPRRRREQGLHVTLACFDLLVDKGKDVMALPLVQRKARLARTLAGKLPGTLLLVGDLPADAALFQHVLDLQLEGFVAKKRASPYTQGPERCGDWLKVKRKGAVPPERFKRSPKA